MTAAMQAVCALADIPDGGSRGIWPNARGQHQAFVVRQGGQVYGYVNNCPHYDRARLGWKKDAFLNGPGDRIMCASHGALFRITDGKCEIGPCIGQSLRPIAVRVREGHVFTEPPH
ncbi:hypothetical protein AN189_07970 [Loktanella sp. 3ANDIMAR09]|uniref:Rieske (2Fe-2S) protein n=1 Tax=Loktanella sp. 3ANDIMAR09 TaxID=1225657 RepID=UPI0006F91522|nr:Rieske (2Fe-2S) protein [Loktanella sp. 3ANDIMAR09]KQI68804.1 hypothetical protein AN189_07970 [Loktanella sp. 3ANDIMAR09]